MKTSFVFLLYHSSFREKRPKWHVLNVLTKSAVYLKREILGVNMYWPRAKCLSKFIKEPGLFVISGNYINIHFSALAHAILLSQDKNEQREICPSILLDWI